MKRYLTIFITAHLLIAASSCIAMEKNTSIKPHCITFIDDATIVVGGNGGCGIFEKQSKTLIKKLTNNPVYHLAANKDVVAFIDNNTINFFDAKTGTKKWKTSAPLYDYDYTKTETETENEKTGYLHYDDPIILSTTGNMLFVFSNHALHRDLIACNYVNQTTQLNRFVCNDITTKFPIIACHPITNHVLIPLSKDTLSLVQPDGKSLLGPLYLETNNTFHGGQYSPDGAMIAMSNADGKYFICDLKEDNPSAYQLGTNDKDYIVAAFHPHTYLLALLSNTINTGQYTVQYWDYKSRVLIAETTPLAISMKKIFSYFLHNRLAFSPNGSLLAVALKDRWLVLPVPYHYALITHVLRNNKMLLPELIATIIQNIAHITNNHYRFSFLDLIALAHVEPLSIPECDQENVTMNVENKAIYKNIKIVYHNQH
jgi:WD40 repeat protein